MGEDVPGAGLLGRELRQTAHLAKHLNWGETQQPRQDVQPAAVSLPYDHLQSQMLYIHKT